MILKKQILQNVDLNSKNDQVLCQKHLQPYAMFCTYTNEIFCIQCISQIKNKNNLISIHEGEKFLTNKNQEFKKSFILEKSSVVDKNIKKLQQNQHILDNSFKQTENEIQLHFQTIIERIFKRQQEIINQLNENYKYQLQLNNKQLDKMNALNDMLSQIKNVNQKNTNGQLLLFAMQKSLKINFQNLPEIDVFDKDILGSSFNFSGLNQIFESIQNFAQKSEVQVKSQKQTPQKIITKRTNSQIQISSNNQFTPINLSHNYASNKFVQQSNFYKKLDNQLSIKKQKCQEIKAIIQDEQIESLQNELMESTKNLKDQQDEIFKKNQALINQNEEFQLSCMKKQEMHGNNFFNESQIIGNLNLNLHESSILPQFCKKTRLLYSLKDHGQGSQFFHDLCDNHNNLFFIIQTSHSIFGFFTSMTLQNKTGEYLNCVEQETFIFSIKTQLGINPMKFPLKKQKSYISLFITDSGVCLGSTIQKKEDLLIDFDDLNKCSSNIGYAYSIIDMLDGQKILAGQPSQWDIHNIEVFHLIN